MLLCGTQNIATAHRTYGTLIHKIHGRALPHFDLVLLTMMPMITSDEPSKNTRDQHDQTDGNDRNTAVIRIEQGEQRGDHAEHNVAGSVA